MFGFISRLPAVELFVLFSVGSIVISIIAILLIRQFVPSEIQYKDNPVIGNISSSIGIIYGVLAGLTALYLINNITYTDDAVQREANAIANLYRDSKWLSEPTRTDIAKQIKIYLTEAVDVEWPLMEKGEPVSSAGDNVIDRITTLLYSYHVAGNAELLISHDMIDEIKNLYNARQQRIHMSDSGLNPAVWVVILIGTILTIGINYLFGMNLYMHLITVSASALMTSAMIFLLLTLDKPFQGDFVIDSGSFKAILDSMKK